MYYHAQISLGGETTSYWWDLPKDEIVTKVLIPFVTKQVVASSGIFGRQLINFGAASEVAVAKTEAPFRENCVGWPETLNDATFWKENNCTDELLHELRAGMSDAGIKSLLQRVFAPVKDQAFIIMKFGDEVLDSAYERVVEPTAMKFGYQAIRVDRVQDSGPVTDQILDNIASSSIVIADLTGERPNCYYEAGFAQALGKEVILLIREGERIHFDL
ncbi:MAG: hypothetical protein K0R39_4276, partial [Symbiobacteriaceae bacterium]|nr:hypothetical protein [Symbiobacteriaceae bacterium]